MATNKDFNKLQDLYSFIINEASADELLDTGLELANQANATGNANQPASFSALVTPTINLATASADDLPDEELPQVQNITGRKLSDKEKEKAEKYRKHTHMLGQTKTGLDVWSHTMLENALFLNLKTQLKTGKQHSLLVYGDTGIGKTQTVQAFCTKMAKETGLQDAPKQYEQDTAYLDLDKLTEEQIGILFLDELNHAQVDVFNYLFRVIDNHTFGTTKFSDDIFIVAAGNLGTGHGNVNPLPTGLKRRFMGKGFLILDPDEWIDYAKKAGVDSRIIQFVRSNPYRWLGQENRRRCR